MQIELDQQRLRAMRAAKSVPAPAPTQQSQPAANSTYRTGTLINGHTWKILDPLARMSYVTGFKEGLISTFFVTDRNTTIATVKALFPDGFTMREVALAVDKLYMDDENLPLPIPTILIYAKELLNGTPFSEVELRLREARREFANQIGK
jgi:hypothetical protein